MRDVQGKGAVGRRVNIDHRPGRGDSGGTGRSELARLWEVEGTLKRLERQALSKEPGELTTAPRLTTAPLLQPKESRSALEGTCLSK